MKAIVLSARNSIRRPSLRRDFLLMPLLLACFGLAPVAQAVGPDTDGAIPGANNGEGIGVLVSRTVGIWNTGTGFEALNNLTSGNQNTATGLRALSSDINGGFNTATGVLSLFSNTSGFFNNATGAYSLANNTIGLANTANGYAALFFNTEGSQNTAIGHAALYRNGTGEFNTAAGYQALMSNGTGDANTAIGDFTLTNNTGSFNTAVGNGALFGNTTGEDNTAIGDFAMIKNTTGSFNIALGLFAGDNLTTGDDNIDIGHDGEAGESGTIRIGLDPFQTRTFIAAIRGVTTGVGDAVPVLIDSAGQLGTVSSSRRFKKEIKPMDQASAAILALKPVTFHYKSDAKGVPQFGLIAEEVAEVNPDLVVRDENGEIYTVRYDAVNAMLLNEFLKEHRTVQELASTVAKQEALIAQQQKGMELLTAQLKEQAAQIQKVSAQLEVSKPAPRTVLNK
jgi:uncharacterized coiled-coil protein SlyX